VPETLFVAAGGGGDVIAVALVAAALQIPPEDALIATWAWDRLLVDPAPGPRRPRDFGRLGTYAGRDCEVVAATAPPTGGGSTLLRLRSELGHRLLILDPAGGVLGITEQLASIQSTLSGTQRVYIVDVGGDVLATGREAGLRSPLADAVALAASTPLGAELLIAGAGLDGELTVKEVHQRIREIGGHAKLTLTEPDVSSCLPVFAWHPSEATALLVGAARGLRGVAEIRAAGIQVPLTGDSSVVWSMPSRVAAETAVATWLKEASSFAQAEALLKNKIGWTELDGERRKAGQLSTSAHVATPHAPDPLAQVPAVEKESLSRGTDLLTFRRIAEALGTPHRLAEIRDRLIATRPMQFLPPLWSVTRPH
jgi:hypothetical protein